MSHLGPLVARALVRGVGGRAARSELDKLCEPLKKLVTSHVDAQGWLMAAVLDDGAGGDQEGGGGGGEDGFPGRERVGREERVGWVRRVVG